MGDATVRQPRQRDSTLPRVKVTIRDPNEVCESPLILYAYAPEPKISSIPADVRPADTRDDAGYVTTSCVPVMAAPAGGGTFCCSSSLRLRGDLGHRTSREPRLERTSRPGFDRARVP
jgi:hypothetical protein